MTSEEAKLAQGCGRRTKEQLRTENEALRVIVAEIHWMARRYADGRSSYAPGMLNFRTKELLGMGVDLRGPHYARDGMGRRYDGLTEDEALAAEADMPKAFQQTAKETEERIGALIEERDSARADLKAIANILENRDDWFDFEEDICAVIEGRYGPAAGQKPEVSNAR